MRETMKRVSTLLVFLVTISLPLFLGFTTIRLVIRPAFLRWEYNKAGFPPDHYGLTREQRLELATVAVQFLASWERPETAIQLLDAQTLEGKPLYNQRELDHMIDVKQRTDIIRYVAWAAGVVVVLGTSLLYNRIGPDGRRMSWSALLNGAILTAGILAAISTYILVGWETFFTRFHELLFPPGTWTFSYSDSLIRLFPQKFWFDVGLILGISPLAASIVIGAAAYWLNRRPQSA